MHVNYKSGWESVFYHLKCNKNRSKCLLLKKSLTDWSFLYAEICRDRSPNKNYKILKDWSLQFGEIEVLPTQYLVLCVTRYMYFIVILPRKHFNTMNDVLISKLIQTSLGVLLKLFKINLCNSCMHCSCVSKEGLIYGLIRFFVCSFGFYSRAHNKLLLNIFICSCTL